MTERPKTIICDLDGTLIHHFGSLSRQTSNEPVLLDGVIETFDEWDRKGYRIILLTGRKESMRQKTIEQLESLNIFYDGLIMGVGGGERILLLNDRKPNSDKDTATAINVERNKGIKHLIHI